MRIEDTDPERSTQEAKDAILSGLDWLGLAVDGEVVYQSERRDMHVAAARRLLEQGNAYLCYASKDELSAMREQARAEGRPMRYDGTWRDRDPSDAPKDIPPVVRFKAPQSGETVIEDQVQGSVTIANDQLDDMILLRADETPTYMLSVVVDDHDMDVSHVIRGDDHLTNAFRQTQLYKALGWQIPAFAHIPLIHGPDGAKLSKRHGALGIEAYRDMGYLPEAMRNYLLRLGWGHGDDEIISTEQAIEWFDLGAVGRSPARIDFAKLDNLNGHYLRHAENDYLVSLVTPIIQARTGVELNDQARNRLANLMDGLKERAKTLIELTDNAAFLAAQRPMILDEKAEKLLNTDARALLQRALDVLEALPDWSSDSLDEALRAFGAGEGIKFGALAQPLRAALCGRTTSPGIFDVLETLGRDESLARLRDQVPESKP